MSPLLQLLSEATTLQALTVHQPWAWAISSADKDVENRGWSPPKGLVGKAFAIHAGKVYDAESAAWLRQSFGLAVPDKSAIPLGAVVGVAVLERAARDSPSRWAMEGQVHWCLGERLALPIPVPCKGAQGLWAVPPEALAAIRAQLLPGPEKAEAPAPDARYERMRLVQCSDCKGYLLASGPGPHRHGPHRVGGINCLGVKEPSEGGNHGVE